MGDGNIHSLAAFTALLQPHLPPVDTVTSLLTLKDGTPGTFCVSFGQPSISSFDFVVGCEEGSVTVTGGGNVVVTQKVDLSAEEKSFMGDKTGVMSEVKAFAEAVQSKRFHPQQTPELALKDLELVCLIFTHFNVDVNEDGNRSKKCCCQRKRMESCMPLLVVVMRVSSKLSQTS